jgi:hypothetical protein
MFGTIRKHQTWLWAVIITFVIISFVVFFSPYSKMQDVSTGEFGSINGKKVTRTEIEQASREVTLRYFLMTGRWPDETARQSGFDTTRESYQWILLTRKQADMGIEVSDETVADTARDMLQNFERQGLSSPSAFTKQVLQPRGLAMQDFERFLRHFVGLQEMMALAGASGKLVTPQEARELYVRENQPISSEAVLFSASNYLAQVKVTPEAVSQFYSNYLANYRVPDRRQVAYVKFAVTNFQSQAESELSRSNLTEIVDANVQRMGTNYYGGAKNAEEAKKNVREELIRTRAREIARRAAYEFARPLIEAGQPSIAAMEKAAQAQNLRMLITEPFTRENGPQELEAGEDFIKAAFSRTAADPFAMPYTGIDGVYVYGLSKELPSEVPALEQIRARVENDYKFSQASTMARAGGVAFHTAVTNGLAQGKPFAEICKSQNVTPVSVPEFSLNSRSLSSDLDEKVPINLLKQMAFSTEAGKISSFQPTRDGGVVLFVKAVLPVNEEKLKQDLPGFLTAVRRARADEAFQAWFRKEAEKGLIDTPLAQEMTPRGGRS